MESRGEFLVVSKAEAKALLAFAASATDEERRGPSGIIAQGSELATSDGDRVAVLGLDDGASWSGVAYEVPRETWESAIRACPGKGVLALRRGEIAVLRTRLDADLASDADAAERSRLAVATLEYEPGSAEPLDVSRDPVVDGVETWATNAAWLGALALVARASDMPAVMYAPSGARPLRAACGAWWVSVAQVTGEEE